MSNDLKNKFTYIVGERPTPMLMVIEEPNDQSFHDSEFTQFGEWNDTDKCLWSINAYLIYNDEEVVAYSFQEFSGLVWLLRMVNKPLTIYVNKEIKKIIEDNFSDEFE